MSSSYKSTFVCSRIISYLQVKSLNRYAELDEFYVEVFTNSDTVQAFLVYKLRLMGNEGL